jgi:dUTP pyrophosphatase
VNIEITENGIGLPIPSYAHNGDVGMDLYAAIPEIGPWRVYINNTTKIPVGFKIAIPDGYEGQVRSRSGLALKENITVHNSPGTIDQGFRGEVCVLLHNHGNSNFYVNRGDRIAQLVIVPVMRAELKVVENLDDTVRGSGGFGSTGTSTESKS